MAAADYWLCDVCERKTFYDSQGPPEADPARGRGLHTGPRQPGMGQRVSAGGLRPVASQAKNRTG